MKKEDATPGKLVRIPDKDAVNGARQVMLRGGPSLAAVILGYGRYQIQQQGLCGEAIVVERAYADNCLVLLVQKPLTWQQVTTKGGGVDRAAARVAITPTTEWVLKTYTLHSVMDHEAWLAAGESARMIDMEVEALGQRYKILQNEAIEIATEHVQFSMQDVDWTVYTNQITGKVGITVKASLEDHDKILPEMPPAERTRLAEIQAEMHDIIKRLSCAR